MAQRMGDEDYYRVLVEVRYNIRYQSYNPKWDHTRKSTGDLEGSNPLFVAHPDITEEHHLYYLGPYTSLKALEREYTKWEKRYLDNAQGSYKDLVVTRHQTEIAEWKEI